MIDVNTGVFNIGNALEISSGYTFENFKKVRSIMGKTESELFIWTKNK